MTTELIVRKKASKKIFKNNVVIYPFSTVFLCLLICLVFVQPVFCLMSSTNYTIFADDFHSGLVATSTNYRLEGTAGESPVGSTTGATYQILGGYQSMDRSSLSMSITDSSINLGDLSTTAVSSANTTVTITTDSSSGYTLSISNVSGSTITSVADGAVTAGQTEYGFSASGSQSIISGDVSVSAKDISTAVAAITNSQTVLSFKASVASLGSSRQTYQQTITLSASNNL
ncbi:MAG: hypothetical protein ABH832_01030 [bacterium]